MSARIQPIVLTGGASKRFGSDKLRASLGPSSRGEWLIDRPIAALREVFGGCVLAVGACDARVAARADGALPDDHPGAGPIGGVLSALERTEADVFVLAGDLPRISGESVRAISDTAARNTDAPAVLAATDRVEPCIGVYRQAMAPVLRQRLDSGRRSLHDAAPAGELVRVPIPADEALNMNTLEDLRALAAQSQERFRSDR